MKVHWLHNNKDSSAGTFMWDIHDRLRLCPDIEIDDKVVPVVRSVEDFASAVRAGASGSRPDILHGQYGSLVGLLTVLSAAPVRIVSFRGSDIYWRYGSLRNRMSGLIRNWMSRCAALRADAVIVMSHSMRAKVGRWIGLAKRAIYVLPDPAGDIFWAVDQRNLLDRIAGTPHRILVASVQPDNPIKRVELIEVAVDLCRQVGLSMELVVLSGVSREQVPDFIRASDCVALASTHEGWPNIVKEGMLLGRPFVATDVSDLRGHALPGSRNYVVEACPVEFAFAFIDQLAIRVLGDAAVDKLVCFHPDVVALKHRIIYAHHGTVEC